MSGPRAWVWYSYNTAPSLLGHDANYLERSDGSVYGWKHPRMVFFKVSQHLDECSTLKEEMTALHDLVYLLQIR